MKKLINKLSKILIGGGIFLIIGTAGSSDINAISMSQILSQCSFALALMSLGGCIKYCIK